MGSPTYTRVTVPQTGEGEILAASGAREQRKFLRITNVDPTNFCYISLLAAAVAGTDLVLYSAAAAADGATGARTHVEWNHPHVPQGAIRGLADTADVEVVVEVG